MIYYIADLHFFHGKLNTSMDMRGFSDADSMNEYMIERWNNKVTDADSVVIIGDFSMSGRLKTAEVLRRLNGKKMMIRGNHDGFLDKKDFDFSLFEWVESYKEINDQGRMVVLCHYPIICYNGMYHMDKEGNSDTYMLYGHVHDTRDEKALRSAIELFKARTITREGETFNIPCNMINCFCKYSDYEPLSLDEWIENDRTRLGG